MCPFFLALIFYAVNEKYIAAPPVERQSMPDTSRQRTSGSWRAFWQMDSLAWYPPILSRTAH